MTTPATLSRPTPASSPSPGNGALARAEALLEARDQRAYDWTLSEESLELRADGVATRLMDLFRRTREGDVF